MCYEEEEDDDDDEEGEEKAKDDEEGDIWVGMKVRAGGARGMASEGSSHKTHTHATPQEGEMIGLAVRLMREHEGELDVLLYACRFLTNLGNGNLVGPWAGRRGRQWGGQQEVSLKAMRVERIAVCLIPVGTHTHTHAQRIDRPCLINAGVPSALLGVAPLLHSNPDLEPSERSMGWTAMRALTYHRDGAVERWAHSQLLLSMVFMGLAQVSYILL
jgi:hypothetical protein